MNPEKGNYNGNEQLENEEQAINEPLTQEEEDQLTQEKLRADADQEEKDEREARGEVDDSYSMLDYYKENPIMR